MSRTVRLSHDYPVDPDRLWRLCLDFDALAAVSARFVRFTGLPEGASVAPGGVYDVEVSLFGLLPATPYRMEIVAFDADARRLHSREVGAGVREWSHTMQVEEIAEGARLHDTIVIDAGSLTALYAIWARIIYAGRHRPRLRLLGLAR